MRIGVLSDTHIPARTSSIPEEVIKAFEGVDLIIHAGDFTSPEVLEELRSLAPVEAVAGNMDPPEFHQRLGKSKVIDAAGKNIAIFHGQGSPAETEACAHDRFPEADCVVFGHTHRPYNVVDGKRLLFNPGSCVPNPWTDYPSYGMLYIDESDPETGIRGRIIYITS